MTKLGPYELGPGGELQGIYTGDARILSEAIPDESIDLILTDPVYDRIEDYAWLAETAARVLKPDRACAVWISKPKQYNVETVMSRHMKYVTTLYYTVVAKQVRPAFGVGVMSWTTPMLVYAKGKYKCWPFLVDTFRDSRKAQTGFVWNKNDAVYRAWIPPLNKHEGIVWDPFCGTGPTPAACAFLELPCIAFEIDADRSAFARERVRNTQHPLPGVFEKATQLAMDVTNGA